MNARGCDTVEKQDLIDGKIVVEKGFNICPLNEITQLGSIEMCDPKVGENEYWCPWKDGRCELEDTQPNGTDIDSLCSSARDKRWKICERI